MAPTLPLMTANWSSPLFWAIIIGWILSVTLHEFAHGLVAYFGGDYTIRERGLLTLNPIRYANPVMTFILPLIFVAMGAIPLVGAATYIRTDLLRNKAWRSASAAAGPFVNLLCFLACALPLHQNVGWVDPNSPLETWSSVQMFCGAMAVLQIYACFINLIPLPPLDGFRIIQPYLPATLVNQTRNPQIGMGFLLLLFFALSNQQIGQAIYNFLFSVFDLLHFDPAIQEGIRRSYNFVLFGHAD